jgi:putative ATPase
MADVRTSPSHEVPLRLRNAPTRLMKEFGHGKDYRYAHDEEGGYAAGESYFPDEMTDAVYYQPLPRGFEQRIRERLERLRAQDAQASEASDASEASKDSDA